MSNPFEAGDIVRFVDSAVPMPASYLVLAVEGQAVKLLVEPFFKKVGTFHYSILEYDI